jgi:DNA-3-methyladenine glycosylase
MEQYGTDLTGDKIYILDSPKIKPEEIVVSRRIGIIKSVDLPWRFYIKENPYVSKK